MNPNPKIQWDVLNVIKFLMISNITVIDFNKHLFVIQFEPLPIESKSAATVILMLQSPEEDVLVKALESIRRFAEKGLHVSYLF